MKFQKTFRTLGLIRIKRLRRSPVKQFCIKGGFIFEPIYIDVMKWNQYKLINIKKCKFFNYL